MTDTDPTAIDEAAVRSQVEQQLVDEAVQRATAATFAQLAAGATGGNPAPSTTDWEAVLANRLAAVGKTEADVRPQRKLALVNQARNLRRQLVAWDVQITDADANGLDSVSGGGGQVPVAQIREQREAGAKVLAAVEQALTGLADVELPEQGPGGPRGGPRGRTGL